MAILSTTAQRPTWCQRRARATGAAGMSFRSCTRGGRARRSVPPQPAVTLRQRDAVVSTGPARALTRGLRTDGRIGRSWYYPQDFFNGKIGEILVYARALDDAQAKQVAQYLVARWPRP